MWVKMVQHKTSDQYLTSGKISTRSIQRFRRYRLLKTLTKNFNILTNADADANTNTMVTAIALPVLSCRQANNDSIMQECNSQCHLHDSNRDNQALSPLTAAAWI